MAWSHEQEETICCELQVKFCFDNELAPSSREALQCAMATCLQFSAFSLGPKGT